MQPSPKPSRRITGRSVLTTFRPAAYSAEYGIGVPIECAARQCTTYGDRCWRARSERVTADVREHSFWVRSLGGTHNKPVCTLLHRGWRRRMVVAAATGSRDGRDLPAVLILARFLCGRGGSEERAHLASHRLGFVEHGQHVRARDLRVPCPRHQRREPTTVRRGHDAVVRRPQHQHVALEPPQCLGVGDERAALSSFPRQ